MKAVIFLMGTLLIATSSAFAVDITMIQDSIQTQETTCDDGGNFNHAEDLLMEVIVDRCLVSGGQADKKNVTCSRNADLTSNGDSGNICSGVILVKETCSVPCAK